MKWLKTSKCLKVAFGILKDRNCLDFLEPFKLDFDLYEPSMYVGQVEEDVRNNFRVLSETKIGRLDRVKRKERPYVTQLSKTYRTELNLAKPYLNRLE